MAIRVNTVSIGAASTAATAYAATIPTGTGIVAGDLIVVNAAGTGTHVANGMAVTDNVDAPVYTTIKEQQQGGASAHWQQTFFHVATQNYPDGSTVTFTPYAASTLNSFSVDIFRFTLGTIVTAVVGTTIASGTSLPAAALGSAPPIGSLVLSLFASTSGALTPPVALTQGSANGVSGNQLTSTAFITADGTSTFAETWTSAVATTAAGQVVAFTNAGVGIPYKLGSTAQVAGSSSTVVSITTGSNANDALFCIAGGGMGSSVAPTGVTDSKTHTWTLAGSFIAPNGMANWIYQSLNAATTLVGGVDTVTVAWNGTGYAKHCEVIACAGINHTAALDLTATGADSTGSPSATTALGLTNNNELVLAVITAGSASQGITWSTGMTAMDTGLHAATTAVYTSVGTMVVTSSTNPVTASASLGAAAVWGELMITLLPDPPAGAAATVTVTNASPLPAGTLGTSYTNQMTATGGIPPYTWDVTAGALPAGLALAHGGTVTDFAYVGANTGPQGAPTLAGFTGQYPSIGPIGCYKVFYSAGGSGIYTGFLGGDASGGTNAFSNGLEGQIVSWCAANGHPQPFIYVSWGVKMTAAAINTYCSQIPHSVREVGFSFQSEPENAYALSAGATFVADWTDQANKIRAAQANTPVRLTLILSSFQGHYQDGTLTNSSFIPPPSVTDVYGIDLYDRFSFWAGPDMGSTKSWTVWMPMVRGFGKPLALTEFGISGAARGMTASQQNARLQADLAYLKGAFGPGGSVSQLPLYVWLYWNTDDSSHSQASNINQLMSTAADATWAGIAAQQSAAGAGTGTGGLITGTPTAVVTNQAVTIRASDSAATPNTGSKAFTMSVNSSAVLTITTPTPLPGATVGASYTAPLAASGGTPPYGWSLQSGSLPAGLAISGQNVTGTPTGAPGTASFVLKVTDNVAATATLSAQLTVSAAVTIAFTSLPAGTVGVAYSATLTATGGSTPYTWTYTGTLPDGLRLDSVAGTISGTPLTAGVQNISFTVTDSTGSSATSNVIPLSIALLNPGGLPPIGRRRFGGQESDWTFGFSGANLVKAANVNLTFYTALVGGTQITDLTTTGGGAISSVTSDANGAIGEFFGPAGVWKMAADANAGAGPRVWMKANDMGDEIATLWAYLSPLTG